MKIDQIYDLINIHTKFDGGNIACECVCVYVCVCVPVCVMHITVEIKTAKKNWKQQKSNCKHEMLENHNTAPVSLVCIAATLVKTLPE